MSILPRRMTLEVFRTWLIGKRNKRCSLSFIRRTTSLDISDQILCQENLIDGYPVTGDVLRMRYLYDWASSHIQQSNSKMTINPKKSREQHLIDVIIRWWMFKVLFRSVYQYLLQINNIINNRYPTRTFSFSKTSHASRMLVALLQTDIARKATEADLSFVAGLSLSLSRHQSTSISLQYCSLWNYQSADMLEFNIGEVNRYTVADQRRNTRTINMSKRLRQTYE